MFNNSTAITLAASLFTGNINNLTINGAGITAGSDLSIIGILNLQSANPSATMGSLEMDIYTLTLGANANTTGLGDVTGIVKRTSFVAGVSYTFGNRYNTMIFQNTGTLPTEMSIRVSIGAAPSWKPDAMLRIIEPIQTGASGAFSTNNLNYLDSELNGNTEANLTLWNWQPGYPVPVEHGVSNINTTQNWIGSANFPVEILPSSFGTEYISFANSQNVLNTWNGSASTDWNDWINWTKGVVPGSADDVIIPNTAALLYEPTMPASTTINSLTIQAGGVVNGGTGTVFTLAGGSGAWIQNGILNPGTSTIVFTNAAATLSGTTNFYNLTINSAAGLTPGSGSIMRIGGSITNNGTFNAALLPNTVEYNGADQAIIIPNGSIPGYHNAILSGSGTKTLSGAFMIITGDFHITGTTTVVAAANVDIAGNMIIDAGTTVAAGAYTYHMGGNITNNGTFTASAGNTIVTNGTSLQAFYGTSVANFYNLTIDNNAGVVFYKDVNVYQTLTLSNGNMIIGENTLGINGTISQTSGYIETSTLSSLSFGGTTAITLASNLFYTPPSINNLSINRSGGVELSCDFTVNGTLNLQSANPTDIKGTLDMGTYTMLMGPSAINTGTGDMTGIVKRTTILTNTEYTFGHQYSSITFPAIGTLPTEISMKISIGVVPAWKANAIKRVYDISQIGGSGTRGLLKAHYLDSELNENEEVNISFFSYIFPSTTLLDRGRTEINTSENWITLNNADFGNLPPVFGVIEHSFGVSTSDIITWDGSESTDWFDQYNWTPADSPDSTKIIIIPDSSTTPRDPVIADASVDTVFNLTIQAGGILSAGAGSQLTIRGSSGAWTCNGTFNASTGKVIFDHGILSNIVTVSGTTDFYDIEVGAYTTLQPVSGCVLRIEGSGTADMTNSQVDFSTINNTVEFNGVNQTIVYPYGIGVNNGFFNLILSGSGTKTMPDTTMLVNGDFTLSGTAYAIAADTMIVLGNTTIGPDASFATGSCQHFYGGNFENSGTFTPTSGGTVSFNGTSAQTISGSSATSFDNLSIANLQGISHGVRYKCK